MALHRDEFPVVGLHRIVPEVRRDPSGAAVTLLGNSESLDDGPTLQELADSIGVELALPEPGDTGIDLDVATMLYWPAVPAWVQECR